MTNETEINRKLAAAAVESSQKQGTASPVLLDVMDTEYFRVYAGMTGFALGLSGNLRAVVWKDDLSRAEQAAEKTDDDAKGEAMIAEAQALTLRLAREVFGPRADVRRRDQVDRESGETFALLDVYYG